MQMVAAGAKYSGGGPRVCPQLSPERSSLIPLRHVCVIAAAAAFRRWIDTQTGSLPALTSSSCSLGCETLPVTFFMDVFLALCEPPSVFPNLDSSL